MEAYEKLAAIGEGTYGVVMKCRHKESGMMVAIKRFKESEDDEVIRKTAMREVRMLKQLKHDHVVNLYDAFRRKGKLYLVFEYVDRTILEDLEKNPRGLRDDKGYCLVRKSMWQIVKSVEFLHERNIIHRDIKPENILVSANGIIKLCDFGFARTLAGPGARYTDYVATRWYRSPELLVGDTEYGKPVDIWAVGCIFAEILTGQPLFPGDSDIDQLYRIMKSCGPLIARHIDVYKKNPLYVGLKVPEVTKVTTLEQKLPLVASSAMNFLHRCLIYDPAKRASANDLAQHPYFTDNNWCTQFEAELAELIQIDRSGNKVKRKSSSSTTGSNSKLNNESYSQATPSKVVSESVKNRPKTSRHSRENIAVNDGKEKDVVQRQDAVVPDVSIIKSSPYLKTSNKKQSPTMEQTVSSFPNQHLSIHGNANATVKKTTQPPTYPQTYSTLPTMNNAYRSNNAADSKQQARRGSKGNENNAVVKNNSDRHYGEQQSQRLGNPTDYLKSNYPKTNNHADQEQPRKLPNQQQSNKQNAFSQKQRARDGNPHPSNRQSQPVAHGQDRK